MEPGPGSEHIGQDTQYEAQIARMAERLQPAAARYLQQGAETLLQDAAELARRRPALFCAGAALAGFAAVRLLRARPPAEPVMPVRPDPAAMPDAAALAEEES